MTIPSSALVYEIMHYEGFCPAPVLNKTGMPCIGYGFPLWEEALCILHGNAALAKSIKAALPKEQENISAGIKRLLAMPCAVTPQKAAALLEQSLLYYAQELGRRHAGFRRLVNLCGNACILPQSGMARYEAHLRIRLQESLRETVREHNKNSAAGRKTAGRAAKAKSQNNGQELFWPQASSCASQPHPAFLASAYGSFDEVPQAGTVSKSKKKKENSYYLPLTPQEQALVRTDAVLFLAHLLGLELTSQMLGFFWALKEDNYGLAASELMAHGAAGCLGAVMHMLARRIRDASLDLRDISVKEQPQAKFVLHRGKKRRSGYMAAFLQKQKNAATILNVKPVGFAACPSLMAAGGVSCG